MHNQQDFQFNSHGSIDRVRSVPQCERLYCQHSLETLGISDQPPENLSLVKAASCTMAIDGHRNKNVLAQREELRGIVHYTILLSSITYRSARGGHRKQPRGYPVPPQKPDVNLFVA